MNTIQKLQSSTTCPAPTGQRLVWAIGMYH